MTWLEWLLEKWPKAAAPVPVHHAAVAPKHEAKPAVPAEFLSLYTYLEHRYAETVVLTFDQMESLLGFALPSPAWTDREWWTGASVRADRHADAWTAARRTAAPNLPARIVAFERLP